MTPVTNSLLQEMTDTIVEAVGPRRIILFGSHARGQVKLDSDVDLMIVEDRPFGPDRSRRREMAQLARLLARFGVPQDILLYSFQNGPQMGLHKPQSRRKSHHA